MEQQNNKKGFTLVELVIVIVIVGILTLVSVNYYQYSADTVGCVTCCA